MRTVGVFLCYSVIGFVLLVSLGILSFVLGSFGFVGLLVILLFFLLLLLYVIVGVLPILFFVPVLITNFAREGRFDAAFDWKIARNVAFDRRYLGHWFVGCCLAGTGSVVYLLLGGSPALLTMLGVGDTSILLDGFRGVTHVAGASVNFYFQVAATYCFGRGYAAAKDSEGADSEQHDAVSEYESRTKTGSRTNEDGRTVRAKHEWGTVRDDDNGPEWGKEAAKWREERNRSRFQQNDE